jgi:hypothetical protein
MKKFFGRLILIDSRAIFALPGQTWMFNTITGNLTAYLWCRQMPTSDGQEATK